MKIRYIILIAFVGLNIRTFGQSNENLDSLKSVAENPKLDTLRIRAINKLILAIGTKDTFAVNAYYSKSVELCTIYKYPVGLADAHFNFGVFKIIQGKHDSARFYLTNSLEIGKQIQSVSIIGRAQTRIGISYSNELRYDQARQWLRKSESTIKGHQLHRIDGTNALNTGNIFYQQSAFDSARFYYEKSIPYFDSAQDKSSSANALANLGIVLSQQSEYVRALDMYLNALRILESIPDSIEIARTLGDIGNIYQNLGQGELALGYHERGLEIKKRLGMKRSMAYSYYNLWWVLSDMQRQAEALQYLRNCLEISLETENAYMASFAHSGLGEAYLELQDFERAEYHLLAAKELRTKYNMTGALGETLNVLGLLAHKRKQYGQSLAYLNKATEIGQELAIPELLRVTSKYVSDLYADLNDYKKAYDSHVQYKALDDSIRNQENTRKIALLESEYAFEKEKEQIEEENERKSREQERQIQQQRYYTYASTGGLISILLIAFFIYRNYKQKQIANQLLSEKNDQIQHQALELEHKNQDLQELSSFKEGLTDMIAHDMKNPLNVVIGLSEGAPDQAKMKQVNQSGKLMLQMVTNMLDVQKFDEAEMKLNLAPHTLQDILIQSKYQVELLAIARSIQFDFQVSPDIHLSCDREVVMRVLVNLFTNGIKYADPGGKITVKAGSLGDRIQVSVSDTGKGILPEDLPHIFDRFWQSEAKKSGQIQSTGLGLTFCKIAIETHGGAILVSSTPGEGSTFLFDLAAAQTSQEDVIKEIDTSGFDLREFLEVIDEIKLIPLYQFADIENALEHITLQDEAVETWKEAVRQAALNWDEEEYEKLLNPSETFKS